MKAKIITATLKAVITSPETKAKIVTPTVKGIVLSLSGAFDPLEFGIGFDII